jgi:hypothetical protein
MSEARQMAQRKTSEAENAKHRAFGAFAWMSKQHLRRDDGVVDNMAMNYGERAFQVLAEHGPVTWLHDGARFASWTDASDVSKRDCGTAALSASRPKANSAVPGLLALVRHNQ